MENKPTNTEKNLSADDSLLPESKLASYQTQNKPLQATRNRQKLLFILLVIVCVSFCCLFFILNKSSKENIPSQTYTHIQQLKQPQINNNIAFKHPLPLPTPTPAEQLIPGTIQWNTTPQQITPQMPLALLNDMKYQPTPYSTNPPDTSPQLQYYNVGTWLSGPYKGDSLVDVIVTRTFPNTYGTTPTTTQTLVIRVSVSGNSIIYFSNSSSTSVSDPSGYGDNKIPKTSQLATDSRYLPDLLPSYPQFIAGESDNKTSISYNGKTELFSTNFSSADSTWNLDLSKYRLLSSFFKGQKLYARSQSGVITYGSIENSPYVIQDVDHSILNVNPTETNNVQNLSWIQQPLTPSSIFDAYGNETTISYDAVFRNGCTMIPTSQMAGTTGFTPDQFQPIANAQGETYALPPLADTLFQSLYSYLTPTIAEITPAAALSYNDFVHTDPVLIGKDTFGEYQIFYRYGYPDNIGGCGKPVIYLYPAKKTQVSVHFSPAVTLSKSEPSYNSGWNVFAYPNGTLLNLSNRKTYPYLYWEGATNLKFPQITTGYVIPKDQVLTFLQKQLTDYGLNSTEKTDFLAYWVPKMQQNPYYLIHFYTTSDLENAIPEYISPKPDTIFRILMWYHPLTTPASIIPQENPSPFNRKGFTVIEWGGVEN